MTDVIFLLASVCFVLLCVAYISWCDRIIIDQSDEPQRGTDQRSTAGDPVAAPVLTAERAS